MQRHPNAALLPERVPVSPRDTVQEAAMWWSCMAVQIVHCDLATESLRSSMSVVQSRKQKILNPAITLTYLAILFPYSCAWSGIFPVGKEIDIVQI